MGKQISFYLNDDETRRLLDIATKQCRRLHDQARYFVLLGLGMTEPEDTELTKCLPGNDSIKDMVRNIFEIIDTYYNEREAAKIEELIKDCLE